MKQEIVEKLFNNKELSTEEIMYICKNLQDGENTRIPFDHTNSHPLISCGLKEGDPEEANLYLSKKLKGRDLHLSEVVEEVEAIALSNNKLLRMLIYQAIRAGVEKGRDMLGERGSIEDLIQMLLRKRREQDDDL